MSSLTRPTPRIPTRPAAMNGSEATRIASSAAGAPAARNPARPDGRRTASRASEAAVIAPSETATGVTPGAAFAAMPAVTSSAARPSGAARQDGSRRPMRESTARPATTDAATSAARVP